ncbi:peptide ABC transporter substrate-binding protein [Thermomicrobiaceae bacterium CFH 74404]|uniref:Peptide ABC transporter substrate-binding protein n=1 Tax=Thermalbibacter longus TaxID=2951981 RepID=A0AA41WB05_9BACT|nr:peptide ABC transporter substrate-binding protein [Thermalbibacter longus]MCM8748162.1 peptide ABC transporter substrate-binding protein [Thermalbibacter longus]
MEDRQFRAAQQLIRDVLAGRLTRREVIRRGAAIGLSWTIVSTLLAACGGGEGGETPQPTAAGARSTPTGGGVDTPVAASTATPGAAGTPKRGGRAVIALIQEPGQMNDFFNGQSGSFLSVLAVEPLFVPDRNGEYQPVLAAEIPTLENGGISEDFLTITYKLRDGITWSDGQPFTAEDIVFTVEVYQNPESTPQVGAAWEKIESARAIDPLTVEVKMSEINPGYLDLFQQVLPKHKFESTAITQEHPLARLPLGTGPFVFVDWKTGDQITLERNPNYRDPEKPYLDGITIKVTPEKEAAIASFVNGEFDYVYFIVTGDLPTLVTAEQEGKPVHVELLEGGASVEWLWFNLSDNGDPTKPHPVLGDPAIREAIDYAIDRQAIIDQVLGGFGSLTGAFIYAGWAAVDRPPTPYDPEKAKQILDAAGWVPGGDGIRVKNGVRASLRYQTIAGDQTRELYQQLVQQNCKDVGIELRIENVPSNTIFGSWQEGGLLARGNYDIVMSRDGYEVDPADWAAIFTSASIPSEQNPGGFTYCHWRNAEFDAAVEEANSTLDPEVRRQAYQRAVEIFARERPALPLYRSASADAWSTRLKGIKSIWFNPRGTLYSAADWYLEE